jgi:NAD dependent epimerase/dehydratase
MNWRDRKVLVTGGTGFVGSHLTERLVREGARVRVLANYKSQPSVGNLRFVDHDIRRDLDVVWGDVTDRDSVVQAMCGCDVVFHLAALIGIPYSYIAPQSYVQTNIIGTMNVLQAARGNGVDRVVHTSTSEAYGSAQYVPMDEKHPLVGQSPYSATKIGADKIAESFYRSFATSVVTVRPFNVFGPRQSDRAIIPTIIAQRVSGMDEIRVGDVRPKRDFTYVTDTVDGFVRAAGCSEAVGKTINIGHGRSISIGDLAGKICDLTGGGHVVTDGSRVRPPGGEVNELLCDHGLASELLDWRPTMTLDVGLERTIAFIREHIESFSPDRYVV